MKKRIFSLFLCLAVAFSLWGDIPAASISAAEKGIPAKLVSGTYAKGEVIVSLVTPSKTSLTKEGTTSFNKDIKVEDSYNFGSAKFLSKDSEIQDTLAQKDYCVSVVSSDKYSTEQLMQMLKDKAYVKNVEPNYYQKVMDVNSPTDPYATMPIQRTTDVVNPTGIPYLSNWQYNTINAKQGWALPTVSSSVVAVVDTGVDYNHEDLAANIWTNPFTGAGLPGLHGYDYGLPYVDAEPLDFKGHGTHCAGVIAAQWNNGKGIAGIAKNTKIMCLKASLDYSELLSTSSIVQSFYYIYKAQCLGVKVSAINCSWGQSTKTTAMEDIMNKIGSKGSLFVFASGNTESFEGYGLNVDAYPNVANKVPYSLNCDYMIIVGACTNADTLSGFSYYSPSRVNIFAPGSNIASCITKNSYSWKSGTSMAAPMVTGALALLAETYPNDTVFQRKARLLQCVRPVSALAGKCTTGGILDLSKISNYVAPANLSWVKITNSKRSLYTRQSMQITTRVGNPDAINSSRIYSVSNKKYACISAYGYLTVYPAGVGKTITVKAASKANRALYSSIRVKILRKKATSVSFTKGTVKLKAGKSCKVYAKVKPTYTTNQSITYTSSNKRYATVGKTNGIVRAKKSGKGKRVIITAVTRDGSKKKTRCTIRIQ